MNAVGCSLLLLLLLLQMKVVMRSTVDAHAVFADAKLVASVELTIALNALEAVHVKNEVLGSHDQLVWRDGL